ncbi:MAG: hypothetical protein JST26_13355 [Bacteroidetes bacterium]|nr:hypothetical protein [Bacteroidota bacterium]
MIKRLPIILCLIIILYSLMVLLTSFSWTGFWTDIVFSLTLFILSFIITFRQKMKNRWFTLILRTISVSFIFVVYSFLIPFTTVFFQDTFKLRSFCFIKADDRIFNAYFKPVGAYSGGYGNLAVTESPRFFPLIEKPVYKENRLVYDLRADTFEGQTVDNREIIRQIIAEKIIHKKQ